MKRSRIYLTAVFFSDLTMRPEKSHWPSISCVQKDTEAIELAQISTTGAAWSSSFKKEPSLAIIKASQTSTTEELAPPNLTLRFCFQIRKKVALSINLFMALRAAHIMETYCGCALTFSAHTTVDGVSVCSPSILFLFPTCLSIQPSKWHALPRPSEIAIKKMRWPFSLPVTRKQPISLQRPWAETDVELNGRQPLLSKCAWWPLVVLDGTASCGPVASWCLTLSLCLGKKQLIFVKQCKLLKQDVPGLS